MSDFFLTILNNSIAASWVVLAVLIVRQLLHKAPRGLICCLWWIVGIRLLCGGMFQAPFSLIPSAETITPESMYDTAPVITSGIPMIDNAINPGYTTSLSPFPGASVNPLQVWTAVAANIWLLVMISIWLWAIISTLRLRHRVSERMLLRENIYLCDRIDTPFILGIFSPKIYLPSDLSEQQQNHVIAHERAHIRRLDPFYKPLAFILLSVHWFNPLLWLAYMLLCRDIELACDEQVIRDMTAAEKKGYSTALLECSVHRHLIAACPLAFGEVGVKERIKAVLRYKKPAFWVVLIAFAVCIALAVGFLTDPVTMPDGSQTGDLNTITEDDSDPFEEPDLGITISVENVTPSGLTLVCTQDGTPWMDLLTGSPWTLEMKTEGGWRSILSENIVWTSIAYIVKQNDTTHWTIDWSRLVGDLEPGTYRIGKHFIGHPSPDTIKSTTPAIAQTCYAEFTIE